MPDTFITRTLNSDPKDRVIVEIGDSKQVDFKPQIKLMRWDNDVNLSIRGQESAGSTADTIGSTIKYVSADYEIHFYEISDEKIGTGFEFEWVLKTKPASNVFTTTLLSKELNFFYQPKLTDEYSVGFSSEFGREIASVTETEVKDLLGNIIVSRPLNVVGSYAVYHKTKGVINDSSSFSYGCGKAFHIYRPKAIDSKGEEVWAELNINEAAGTLTVTVNEKWLETASYPVRIDPTFGNTNLGASGYSMFDYISGYIGTPASSGTTSSISVGINTIAGGRHKYALYKVSDGSLLSPQSAEGPISTGWNTIDVSIVVVGGTSYYVVGWGQEDSTMLISGDSGAGSGKYMFKPGGGSWPTTYSPSTSANSRSAYATYTADSTPVRRRVGMGFRR